MVNPGTEKKVSNLILRRIKKQAPRKNEIQQLWKMQLLSSTIIVKTKEQKKLKKKIVVFA